MTSMWKKEILFQKQSHKIRKELKNITQTYIFETNFNLVTL